MLKCRSDFRGGFFLCSVGNATLFPTLPQKNGGRLGMSFPQDFRRKTRFIDSLTDATKTHSLWKSGKVVEKCGSSRRFGEGGIPAEAFLGLERVFPAFWKSFRLFGCGGNWNGKGKAESFFEKFLKKFFENAERVSAAERSRTEPKTHAAETCGKVAETCGRACVVGVFSPEKAEPFPDVSQFFFHFSVFSFFAFLKSFEKRRNVHTRGIRSKKATRLPNAKSMLFSSVFFSFIFFAEKFAEIAKTHFHFFGVFFGGGTCRA